MSVPLAEPSGPRPHQIGPARVRAGLPSSIEQTAANRVRIAAAIAAATILSLAAPGYAPSAMAQETSSVTVETVADLAYDLDAVRAGAPVPYLVAGGVPEGLDEIMYSAERKDAFFKTVLPLILSVNDDILITRAYLLKINRTIAAGDTLTDKQKNWLTRLAAYYKVSPGDNGILDLGDLIPRVDIIPPSLALAQGAEESGYGTSRFAEEGNALFGQLTRDAAEGMTTNAPELRGTGYLVRAFWDIRSSISAYARNLNTHRAYASFRAKRAEARLAGRPLDSHDLANELVPYCGCGPDYVDRLKNLIRNNSLADFDDATLDPRSLQY